MDTIHIYEDHRIPINKIEAGIYSAVVALRSDSTAYKPETNPHHGEVLEL